MLRLWPNLGSCYLRNENQVVMLAPQQEYFVLEECCGHQEKEIGTLEGDDLQTRSFRLVKLQ
jgi:hypothetical protein